MKKTQMTQETKVETVDMIVPVTQNTRPAWADKMKSASIEAQNKFMETGLFFNGRAGERVRGIFLESEMQEGETKNGNKIWKIQVMRLSSHKEQTLSILQSITTLSDQILAIAEANNWSLKEVFFDALFITGKGQQNYIKEIKQIKPAEIKTKTKEA